MSFLKLDPLLVGYLFTEEAENAITAYVNEQKRMRFLNDALASATDSTSLALTQYKSGLIDFQAVLDAQRTFLSLKDNLAVSKDTVMADLVRLYKALGGGSCQAKPPLCRAGQKR